MMISLHGSTDGYALFTNGSSAVIVNTRLNMVEDIGPLADLSYLQPWDTTASEFDDLHMELASGVLTDLSVKTITADAGRLYTIPKAAQDEAIRALAWRKKHGRGGTPVGLNTARILAKGGQIGIKKVRHIARYFPRHEVDKKGKGYKPGQDGFPSNGRIAWALWGGDPAWRWAQQIVEREDIKKSKSVTSSGYDATYDDDSIFEASEKRNSGYDSNINAFELASTMDDSEFSPEFVARVRMDGSGIDRLYMINEDSQVLVWDGKSWDDIGHVDSDIATYDRSLDDPYDTIPKSHILIDPESALILSAHFQENPFKCVSIMDLNAEEAQLVLDAAEQVDWLMVDSSLVSAAESEPSQQASPDGTYTPEERSVNASRQLRDKSGKFSKMGAKVAVDGDPNRIGRISAINKVSGMVTVTFDNGTAEEVDPKRTEAAETLEQKGVSKGAPSKTMNTAGILGQQRPVVDRPVAYIPTNLPAFTKDDLQDLISNYPAWVVKERQKPEQESSPKSVEEAYESSEKERPLGEAETAEDTYGNSLIDDVFERKKSRSQNSPMTSAAGYSTEQKLPEEKSGKGVGKELTPETSDVQPIFLAIVSPDDPTAVMDLVSIVPKTANTTSPSTFKRVDGQWQYDPQVLADISSPTPPPVIPLKGDAFKDVLEQVDGTLMASGYAINNNDLEIISLHSAHIDPLVAVGEGGLDRNRGNAEKLRRYWLYGRGALKIRWNTPGDWTRCYRHLSKYMGPRAKGYCSLRHKEATGVWPGSKFNIGKRNIRGSAFDYYDVAEEHQVLAYARIRAALADARSSDPVVAGGNYSGASFIIPIVIPEETETGDGRIFKKGSISMRELPLPLLWQIKTSDGHDGSVVVGRIDSMERVDGGIGNARGVFDSGHYGSEAERMVREGFCRGVSADLDKFEASEEDDENLGKKKDKIGGSKIKVDKARVMAVTIVPKPAFEECKIYIDGDEVSETQEDIMDNVPDGIYVDNVDELDAGSLVACGAVASAIPTTPPADWFENPNLSGPTPLTVDDTGRVFGHIAAWNVDHIGMTYGTKPPKSKTNYSYFHTGVVRADNGKDYPVGQLTLAGGHASLEASAAEAARHYDDTGSAIADVHAGEDSYGIWVAGALRPNASPEQIRALRASAPSGDWRPIKGNLELVAVCQVNVPGFPIARARVASGQVYALVAAGAMTLAKMKKDPITDLASRLEQLEIKNGVKADPTVLSAQAAAAKAKIDAVKAERVAELSAKMEAIAAQVRSSEDYESFAYISEKTRSKLAEKGEALPDGSYPIRNLEDLKNAIKAYGRAKPSKRAKVRRHIMKRARALGKSDLIPENWKSAGLIDDDIVDDLKARVASASTIENYESLAYMPQETRDKLAKEGKALPDGSYPIRNVEDLKNAIQAYGRSKPSKRAAVRRHIMKRARALGKSALIPENWKSAGLIDDDVVDGLKAKVASLKSVITSEEGDTPLARSEADSLIAGGVIVAEEQELADALVAITEKYGKFNEDDTGVWAGYVPASENENAAKGVNCSNCMLYNGGTSCKILATEVEPMGSCRFALIPDGVVK